MNNLFNIASGFNLFGLEIKFYGIIMALSYVIALGIGILLCKKKGYNSNLPYKLLLIIFPLAVIGGRLGYVIFSGRSWSFLEILNIRSGGLMLYGGVAFALIGIIIYALVTKQNIIRFFDLLVPCFVIAQTLGRWGNFFNQEAFGYVVDNPALQWFPFSVFIEADGMWHLATFFYESLWCFITFFVVYFIYLKTDKIGLTTCTYLLMYGTERYFVEGLRTDSLYIGNVRVSQLISIIMIGVAIGYFICQLILYLKKRKLQTNQEAPVDDADALILEETQSQEVLEEVTQSKEILQENELETNSNLENQETKAPTSNLDLDKIRQAVADLEKLQKEEKDTQTKKDSKSANDSLQQTDTQAEPTTQPETKITQPKDTQKENTTQPKVIKKEDNNQPNSKTTHAENIQAENVNQLDDKVANTPEIEPKTTEKKPVERKFVLDSKSLDEQLKMTNERVEKILQEKKKSK